MYHFMCFSHIIFRYYLVFFPQRTAYIYTFICLSVCFHNPNGYPNTLANVCWMNKWSWYSFSFRAWWLMYKINLSSIMLNNFAFLSKRSCKYIYIFCTTSHLLSFFALFLLPVPSPSSVYSFLHSVPLSSFLGYTCYLLSNRNRLND